MVSHQGDRTLTKTEKKGKKQTKIHLLKKLLSWKSAGQVTSKMIQEWSLNPGVKEQT